MSAEVGRSVRGGATKLRKRVFQSRQSCVNAGRQLTKFIMGIRHREPSSQPFSRYLARTAGYPAHRRKRTVSDEVAANCGESHAQWQPETKNGSKSRHSSPKLCLRPKDPQQHRVTCDQRLVC